MTATLEGLLDAVAEVLRGIEGLRETHLGLASGRDAMPSAEARPAAWVALLGERVADGAQGFVNASSGVRIARLGLLLCVNNPDASPGREDVLALTRLRARVLEAVGRLVLAGWGSAFFQEGALVSLADGALWWMDEFEARRAVA